MQISDFSSEPRGQRPKAIQVLAKPRFWLDLQADAPSDCEESEGLASKLARLVPSRPGLASCHVEI